MTNRVLKSNQGGFTLVEVMLVVFVLAITALAFGATFPTAQTSRIKAANMTYAISVAEKSIEELKAGGYSNMAIMEPTVTGVDWLPGGTQTLEITQYNARVKKISVNITWGGYRQVGGNTTLVTLVSDHG